MYFPLQMSHATFWVQFAYNKKIKNISAVTKPKEIHTKHKLSNIIK